MPGPNSGAKKGAAQPARWALVSSARANAHAHARGNKDGKRLVGSLKRPLGDPMAAAAAAASVVVVVVAASAVLTPLARSLSLSL